MSDGFDIDTNLKTLWQQQPQTVDANALVARVAKLIDAEKRFGWMNLIVLVVVLAITVWLDLIGVYRLPGILSVPLALSGLWCAISLRRVYRRVLPEATLGTRALLVHALQKARLALRNARLTYGLFPASAAFGYLTAPLLTNDGPGLGGTTIGSVVTALLLLILLAAIVWGLREARIRKREVAELERRLAELDTVD